MPYADSYGKHFARHKKNKTHAFMETKTKTKKTDRRYTGDAQTDFHNFFVDQLKDLYWAEQNLKKGLCDMAEAATTPRLRKAFEKHYNEGDGQIATLEKIFELLGERPEAKRCDAMAGLLKEAKGIIDSTDEGSMVRDAALILAAQKVEHYEIASYGTLYALSAYLPERRVATQIKRILDEEKRTNDALTQLAETVVNECAAVE